MQKKMIDTRLLQPLTKKRYGQSTKSKITANERTNICRQREETKSGGKTPTAKAMGAAKQLRPTRHIRRPPSNSACILKLTRISLALVPYCTCVISPAQHPTLSLSPPPTAGPQPRATCPTLRGRYTLPPPNDPAVRWAPR